MITWDLKLNEKDTEKVEVWVKYGSKSRDYLVAIIHEDWFEDDESIIRRLEDGETVAVSVREI